MLKGRPFSVLQLPSALRARRGFGHDREESEAPDGKRRTGRACSSPPGNKRDFSRDTLQAGPAMPTRWKVVDAVFPFTAALPSTCCVPAERRGPAPTATEPSGRSPPQRAAGVGRTWEVEVL